MYTISQLDKKSNDTNQRQSYQSPKIHYTINPVEQIVLPAVSGVETNSPLYLFDLFNVAMLRTSAI